MGNTSREKGKRGEREVVNLARALWGAKDAVRSVQVDGTLSADVLHVLRDRYRPGSYQWHVEVKRIAKYPALIRDWLAQVETDAEEPEVALLFHREDDGPWYVTLRADMADEFAKDLMAQLQRDV